jgi:chromosomal replication initiation ATPase DnaA
VNQRPRNTPEAAQYPLPLVEPKQLDLFGFATARAMGNLKSKSRDPEKNLIEKAPGDERPASLRPLDPTLELSKDPWSSEHFVDGAAYSEAEQILSAWKDWPRPAMALIGPHWSGKTHLARIWANDIGGRFESSASLATQSAESAAALVSAPLVVDMADHDLAPLQLFSIFNAAYRGGGPVIFVGNAPPAAWTSSSSDLLSRFSSLSSVRIHEPDDELLAKILQSICRKRFIRLDDTVAWGLINRSAQSFETLAPLADGIERLAEIDALEPSARVLERILTYARMASGAREDGLKD